MGVENHNEEKLIEILSIKITFHHYNGDDGDGVEILTDPNKNKEVIKTLSDSSFLTTAVISNAIEIVAHNSAAAIYIVNKYGDQALKTMLEGYTNALPSPIDDKGVDTGMLNEMLKYMKGGQSN